ncbi:Carbonic anhydrase [Azospirillaceae bacterium]
MTGSSHDHNTPCCNALAGSGGQSVERRDFLKLATLGAGVALFASFAPRVASAGGTAEVILLSCMDYRLIDKIGKYMESRHLTGHYDHVILAGASLGAVTDKFPAWNEAFWQHLGVAIDLHHVKKLVIMDHRDCGAYKVVFGTDYGKDPEAETKIHSETLRKLAGKVKEKKNDLEIELLLMALDGSVATVSL